MTCEAFDAALPDYLEGTLDESMRASVELHLRECVRCASLVRDVENIRKEAAALPDLVPSRDLWEGIESRIAAPVIPLPARSERRRSFAPAWMGIAAAALVVTTAGLTYTLTARSLAPRQDGSVARTAPPASQTQPEVVASSPQEQSPNPVATTPRQSEGGSSISASQAREASVQRAALPANFASVDQISSERVYGKEIEMLQRIVGQRKAQLDSSTIAIIENNLRIIDTAIEQSRAALAKDPASRLLGEQLTNALDKKVELLRTAARLPAST
jgi:anti-sigma factor RsiW